MQEGFEDTGFAARGWYDNTNLTITDGGAPAGRHQVSRGDVQPGVVNADFRRLDAVRFTPTETVYLSYWVKYSSNWVGSGVSYHPHEFQFITDEDGQYIGPSATHLTTYVEHNYQNGGVPILAMQDALNIDAARLNQDLSLITENRAAAGATATPTAMRRTATNPAPNGGTASNGRQPARVHSLRRVRDTRTTGITSRPISS